MSAPDRPGTTPGRAVRIRSGIARRSTLAVSSVSRRLHLGAGSTIGGRVGLAVDRGLLGRLGAGHPVGLVSGTNGKTTTTRMLAEAVALAGPVASSRAGANMTAGLVTALASAPAGGAAILEVDEAHLPEAIDVLSPVVVVLLNLSRDQLDRVSEVRLLAERWRLALDGRAIDIVANADDPLIVYATGGAPAVRYVGAGGQWHEDAHHCPRCDARITYPNLAVPGGEGWHCACGFARPPLDAWIDGSSLRFPDGSFVALEPGVPGRFNIANAAMAALAAEAFGIERSAGAAAIAAVHEVEGRFSRVTVAGRRVRLLLAKNPAGFTELLELVRHSTNPVVIGINAEIADGHDPSWLWDVPFELLGGRQVIATGDRAADLAERLLHADVEVSRIDEQSAAIARSGSGEVDYIGNYTAFQQMRRVARRKAVTGAPPPVTTSPATPLRVKRAPARAGASKLRIVTVHPDLLGTYGDGGNGRVLANRARWHGYDVELVTATADRPLPESADLYLLGGGEDGPQLAATEALRSGSLARALERGAVVLAVCAGYQILGHAFPAPDGSLHAGLGLLDVTTVRGESRAVGEIVVERTTTTLTGFENHSGRTERGEGVAPLGAASLGTGNGDGTDGAVAGRIFASYLHGPVLARNPEFADELLGIAVGLPLGSITDPAADDLHRERVARARATRAQRVARAR